MKTTIKVYMLKATTFLTALFFTSFSFLASLVIFAESINITQNMGYTNTLKYGILFGIGFVLIWLVTLATESSQWIMKRGFKKADDIKRSL
jgi:quinol-cytochrome oxidoreductase complex cytochrome b subunit